MVENKIVTVADEVACMGCTQEGQGSCRAFCVPHSMRELKKRKGGKPKCIKAWVRSGGSHEPTRG